MCKKLLATILFLLTTFGLFAQFNMVNGTHVVINQNTNVFLGNGLISSGATLNNNGIIDVDGDFVNNSGPLMSSSSTGTLIFDGPGNQEITGDYDVDFYGTVIIDNIDDVSITSTLTGSSQTINDSLIFVSGKLILNSFDLSIGDIDIDGVNQNSYVVTNSIGSLRRYIPADGSSIIPFQIGNDGYNPILMRSAVSAVSDSYSIRVVDSKPGLFPVTDHGVSISWVVDEDISGGSDFEVRAQWNIGDEDSNFDRTSCNVGLTVNDGLTVDWSEQGAALGVDPYTRDGNPFNSSGVLFIADYYHGGRILNLDFILGGAFNGTTMATDINNFIPLDDPYGLSTSAASVPSSVVDWVRIDLCDENDKSIVLQSYALFVDNIGRLLDVDGSVGASITGADGPVFISVRHRNHLQIISSLLIDFSVDNPSYDFISGQSNAWQNPLITGNYAMKDYGGSFVMWPGDADSDGKTDYLGLGLSNDRLTILDQVGVTTPGEVNIGVYSNMDINMDGDVIYNGTNSDRASILYQTGYNTPEVVIYAHIP